MLLGITGSPGSGKSVLSRCIAEKGWSLVNADEVGRDVVESDRRVLDRLASAFGEDIVGTAYRLDRRLLAKRAFSSPENTRKLNDIVHPALIGKLQDRIKSLRKEDRNIVVDCALIFEWEIEHIFDIIVCVFADRDIRIRRLIERDGRTEAEIEDMFRTQLPEEEKIRKSHLALANNASIGIICVIGAMLADIHDYIDS